MPEAPAAPAPSTVAKAAPTPNPGPQTAASLPGTRPSESSRMRPPVAKPGDGAKGKEGMKERLNAFATEAGKAGPAAAPSKGAEQHQNRPDRDGNLPPKPAERKPAQEQTERTEKQPEQRRAAEAPERQEGEEAPEVKADETGYLSDAEVLQKKSGELGRHYKNLKKENIGLKAALTKAREAQANYPERGKLSDTLKQKEERLAAVEQELRYTNYERSEEYKTQYWEPYVKAYNSGRQLTTELMVKEVKDDVTGEISQARRPGTDADFDQIVSTANTGEAAELAERMFGPTMAAEIMRERRKVQELLSAKEGAKEKFKKEGGEIMAKRMQDLQKQGEEAAQTYKSEIERGLKEHADWFGEVEGDDKANARLARGYELADAAFTGKMKNPDGSERQLPAKELAKLHAAIRNKAGAFDKVVFQRMQDQKRIADLEAKLKEYEASEPGGGDGGDAPAGDRARDPENQRGPKGSKGNVTSRMNRFIS